MAKKRKVSIDWKIIATGIICLTLIEIFAMSHGINGALRTTIVGAILLTIGITIPKPRLRG